MKKSYYIILSIIIILIIGLVIFFSTRNNEESQPNNMISNSNTDMNKTQQENSDNNTTPENAKEIESMKNEINATGTTDIYQIEEEYDGRKILQVKPNIQFDVDLAGIIKKSKPEENELSDLLRQAPTKNGVWVSEQSRERFSELLRNNNIENFYISDEGYLQINNSNSELTRKIENMTKSDKLYIINMTGIGYQRDYISGEIVEYPFEEMDPYQILEPYQKENKVILEITTNKIKKLSESEILDTITNY